MPTPSQVLPPQVLAEVTEALRLLRHACELRDTSAIAGAAAQQYENQARAMLAVVVGQLPNPMLGEVL